MWQWWRVLYYEATHYCMQTPASLVELNIFLVKFFALLAVHSHGNGVFALENWTFWKRIPEWKNLTRCHMVAVRTGKNYDDVTIVWPGKRGMQCGSSGLVAAVCIGPILYPAPLAMNGATSQCGVGITSFSLDSSFTTRGCAGKRNKITAACRCGLTCKMFCWLAVAFRSTRGRWPHGKIQVGSRNCTLGARCVCIVSLEPM